MGDSSAVPIYTETGISRELDRNSGACELVSLAKVRGMMRVHSRLLHEHGKCLGGLPGHCIRSIRSLYHLSGTSPVSKTSPGFEFDNEIDPVVQHSRRSSCDSHKQAVYCLYDIPRAMNPRPRAPTTMNACTSSTWTFVLSSITPNVQA